jgi:hypothetical protein
VTVDAGATLQPGSSPGTLSTAGQVWSNGGNYNWMIYDAIGTAGTGYSQLALTGGLDLSSLTTGGFKINLWSLFSVGPDANGDALNFNNASAHSWTLATTTGITGFNAGNFTVNTGIANGTGGFSNALGGGTFGLSVTGNDLRLNFTPVVNSIWGAAGSDNLWTTSTNWSAGVPDGQGTTAQFTGNAPALVKVDGTAKTVGRVLLSAGDVASCTIGSGADMAALKMDNANGTDAPKAFVTATSGDHTIASQIFTTSASHLDVTATGTDTKLHLTGGIDNSAAKNLALINTATGAGTLDVGDIANAGAMSVSGTVGVKAVSGIGSTSVSGSLTANSIVQDTLSIGAGGSVTIRETPFAAGQSNVSQVPEPGTWALLCAGAVCLVPLLRRRIRHQGPRPAAEDRSC